MNQFIRPPTAESIAREREYFPPQRHRSLLSNADRAGLEIFPKPWRGIAREGGHGDSPEPVLVYERLQRRSATRFGNAVLPAGFTL